MERSADSIDRINRVGFTFGLIAFTATVGFVVAQVMQLFDALRYPWDEILIYGFSLCIPIPFLLEMLALHYRMPRQRRYWTHAALLLTTLYAVFVIANYSVQLGTVIPMTLQGRSAEIQILVQTPHSLFWDFDAVGYIFMGLATLAAAAALQNRGYQKWVRLVFLMHSLTTPLIAVVYFYPNFSEALLLLGLPWGITAPAAMLTLAFFFKQR